MKHSIFRALARASAILLIAALTLPLALSGCVKSRAEKGSGPREEPATGNPSALFEPAMKGDVLPTLTVTTDNGLPVRTTSDKAVTVSLSGAYYDEYDFEDLHGVIKCRGNSTLRLDKKSFRLKFDKKINLLGQGGGKAKSWVLLAEHGDESLLRNHVAFAMAHRLDAIGFVTSSSYVRLILNGEDAGIYHLVEQHQAGKHRIRVNEDPDAADTDYLIEWDAWQKGDIIDPPTGFKLESKEFIIRNETMNMEKFMFVFKYFTDVDTAIHSGDMEEIEKLIDLPSFVDMYLLHEITMNVDVGWSSFFLVKKAGGKLYCDCPWDFDLALGNDPRVYGGEPEGLYVGDPETLFGRRDRGNPNEWFIYLMMQEWFVDMVVDRWNEVKDGLREAAIGEIDRIYSVFGDQMASNFDVWPVLGTRVLQEPSKIVSLETYKDHVDYLRNWLERRFDWLDGYFSDPETRYRSTEWKDRIKK